MKPVWWDSLMELLNRRQDAGWYYPWNLGYNEVIDWRLDQWKGWKQRVD
ncbi:hypothetical protein R2325_02650 [Mycobacteroides chelonae]|nr:hypothetical protein [Mycobacteroides chelonae]MEC4869473.1 hypothetical protein [Mycobacteroides chelonae]